MPRESQVTQVRFSSCQTFSCPAQILVVDQTDGPANILIDTVSLLLDREVSVVSVEDHVDALRALDYYHFDLVVVGLRQQRPLQLTMLPRIQEQHPNVPILAVGRDLPRLYRQYARTYGAREVLNLPQRAADLKTLVRRMAEHWLTLA